MILPGLVLWFGTLTIFLTIVEEQFLKKVRKHEKQITLIEKQANAIKHLVSKALSDNEVSKSEFEMILLEITK